MSRSIVRHLLLPLCLAMSGPSVAEDIDARLDWSDPRALGTTVNGPISQVLVRPGQRVKAGDLLVELDQRQFSVNRKQATARLEQARLERDEARREQERAIELYDRTVLSVSEREQADILLAGASASFANARAELERASLVLEYSQLKAPFDAVILRVDAAPGEVVVNRLEARTLVSLARADQMLAIANVTSRQLDKLTLGQQLQVAFRGEWLDGQVHGLALQPLGGSAESEPLYSVSVQFDVDPQANPRAGEPSAIRLPD